LAIGHCEARVALVESIHAGIVLDVAGSLLGSSLVHKGVAVDGKGTIGVTRCRNRGRCATEGTSSVTATSAAVVATLLAIVATLLAVVAALLTVVAALLAVVAALLTVVAALLAVVASVVAAIVVVTSVVIVVATTVSNSEADTVVLGTALSDRHEDRLVVGCGSHGTQAVVASRETTSDGSTQQASVVAGVVDALEEGKGGSAGRSGGVLAVAHVLNDDVSVADDLALTVDILGRVVVGDVGVGEGAGLKVVDLDRDLERLLSRDGVAVLGVGEDGRNHLVCGGDVTHGHGITRSATGLETVGNGLALAEVDEVVVGGSRGSLARISVLQAVVGSVLGNDARVQAEIVVVVATVVIVVVVVATIVSTVVLAAIVAAIVATVVTTVATTELPLAEGLTVRASVSDESVRSGEGVCDGDEADKAEKNRLGEHIGGSSNV